MSAEKKNKKAIPEVEEEVKVTNNTAVEKINEKLETLNSERQGCIIDTLKKTEDLTRQIINNEVAIAQQKSLQEQLDQDRTRLASEVKELTGSTEKLKVEKEQSTLALQQLQAKMKVLEQDTEDTKKSIEGLTVDEEKLGKDIEKLKKKETKLKAQVEKLKTLKEEYLENIKKYDEMKDDLLS